MSTEIERKFLVKDQGKIPRDLRLAIKQGYIKTHDNTAVRVRISNHESYLTIKGENDGISRSEYEYKIPFKDANEMINTLCDKVIIKVRYLVKIHNKLWEIDIFKGENEGLIVAEVELDSEDEDITIPDFCGEEVSDDPKYYNINLVENPYSTWDK